MTNLESLLRSGRAYSSTRTGSSFDAATIQSVWGKGLAAFGGLQVNDPTRYRFDACGALIERSKYGDTNSNFGWEIDHIMPVSAGGSDALWNFQPLQWRNNRFKADNVFTNAADYRAVSYDGKINR